MTDQWKTPETLEEADARIRLIVSECGAKGWDSYDAQPVHPRTGDAARALLRAIGVKAASPSPHGSIAFEWEVSDGTVFVETDFVPRDEAEMNASRQSESSKRQDQGA